MKPAHDAGTRRHRPTVAILLPARDEEQAIGAVLARVPRKEIEARGYGLEVVVMDGRSTDRTRDIAQQFGARVLIQEGRGKGRAVRAALEHLDTDFVVMLDADDSYPMEEVPRFLDALERGYDIVMGSRLDGAIDPGAMSGVHHVGNRLLSLMASLLYARTCTDVCTGMWAFRRESVRRLPLTSTRFEIEAELFALASRSRLRMLEMPIRYRRRAGETKLSGLRDGVLIGLTLISRRLARVKPAQAANSPAGGSSSSA